MPGELEAAIDRDRPKIDFHKLCVIVSDTDPSHFGHSLCLDWMSRESVINFIACPRIRYGHSQLRCIFLNEGR